MDKPFSPSSIALATTNEWKNILVNTTSPKISVDLMQRWLVAPQRTWLEQLQLKPSEWFDNLDDYDPVSLQEWERKCLFDERFVELFHQKSHGLFDMKLDDLMLPSWDSYFCGQGKFPLGASGKLEMRKLAKRWENLFDEISKIGNPSVRKICLGGIVRPMLFAGENLIIFKSGKVSSRTVMEAWLNHLLVCANINPSVSTYLIFLGSSKAKKDRFEVNYQFTPISSNSAIETISQIESFVDFGLKNCWPVPPESGWSYVVAENKSFGSGKSAFVGKWNGAAKFNGERDRVEMRLCFGYKSVPERFLESESFYSAIELLYNPILNNIQQ